MSPVIWPEFMSTQGLFLTCGVGECHDLIRLIMPSPGSRYVSASGEGVFWPLHILGTRDYAQSTEDVW